MYNQIKVELNKLITSRFSYVTILCFVTFGLMQAGVFGVGNNIPVFTFQQALLSTFSDVSLFFVLSLFVSYFIGNDFTNRTINNEIGIGYTRLSVIISRTAVALPFTVLIYLAYTVPFALIMGARQGFDNEVAAYEVFVRIILFMFQLMSVLSFSILIMFWCKKSSLGMMISVCFTVVVCNILRNYLDDNAFYQATSFYRIMMNNESMTTHEIQISFISAIVTIFAVLFATYGIFRKAELK